MTYRKTMSEAIREVQEATIKPYVSISSGGQYNVLEKDVKEWAMSDATIDKYKERYKEIWREKLDEVVKRMMDKI